MVGLVKREDVFVVMALGLVFWPIPWQVEEIFMMFFFSDPAHGLKVVKHVELSFPLKSRAGSATMVLH